MNLYKEKRIANDFNGWDGDAIFELTDGSRWQQKKYKYKYKYKHRPKAKIWKDGSRYYLEVDCMNEKIEVIRL